MAVRVNDALSGPAKGTPGTPEKENRTFFHKRSKAKAYTAEHTEVRRGTVHADSNTGILAARYAAEDLAARPSSLSQQSDYYNNPWQDQQLRQIALDYAVRMASMGNGDVVATAEAYYAFLKGDAAK